METIVREALEDCNMGELVSIYNSLKPKTPAGLKTFSTRAKAITRILARQAELEAMVAKDVSPGYLPIIPVLFAPDIKPTTPDGPAVVCDVPLVMSSMEHVNAETEAEADAMALEEVETEQAAAQPVPLVKPAPLNRPRVTTIKQMAMDLLMEEVSMSDDEKAIGWTYEEILTKIRAAFPRCKTSIACLRWYAVHMRQDEFRLPLRPRKEAVEAAQPTE